jgi:hypothetical protein
LFRNVAAAEGLVVAVVKAFGILFGASARRLLRRSAVAPKRQRSLAGLMNRNSIIVEAHLHAGGFG